MSRPRKNKWILQDRRIALMQEELRQERISIFEFLSAASYRLQCQTMAPSVREDLDNDLAQLDPGEHDVPDPAELQGNSLKTFKAFDEHFFPIEYLTHTFWHTGKIHI